MSNVVIWSGGMDSTLILDYYGGFSSKEYPVIALSVEKHPNIDQKHLMYQLNAQIRYLNHAKKKGYHIKHQRIKVDCEFSDKLHFEQSNDIGTGQPFVWLCNIVQFLKDGDDVFFGYIRNDCFWHNKDKFEKAFNSLVDLRSIKVQLKYPYEWHHKYDILEELEKRKIPRNCYVTCDEPKKGEACGYCSKCVTFKNAEIELKEKNERQICVPKKKKKTQRKRR